MSRNAIVSSGAQTLQALGLAAILCVGASGTAQAASNKVAWVLADQPDAASPYTPNPSYSYNSTGGSITVTHYQTGRYHVDFGNILTSQPSNVQVSAFGTIGYCATTNWQPNGSLLEASIECYDVNGNRADSAFTMLYQARDVTFGSAGKGLAFLVADQPTVEHYSPNPNYTYNSTGKFNSIVRNGVGNYTVTLPGLSNTGGDIQVTHYFVGPTDPGRCKSDGWLSNGTDTVANVECFGATGAPSDEMFSLAFALNEPFGLTTASHSRGAYAWANLSTRKRLYTPAKPWNFSSFRTGRMTSQKNSTGNYTVGIPGSISYSSSLAMVTGFDGGTGSAYCNVVDWFPIVVQCYGQGGTPVDSDFDVTFLTKE